MNPIAKHRAGVVVSALAVAMLIFWPVKPAAAQGDVDAALAAKSLHEILNDAKLKSAAIERGKAAFTRHCAVCHQLEGAPRRGIPVLSDDDWLWGGEIENIHHVIAHGIRYPKDLESRSNDMPAFGKGIFNASQIDLVAEFVLSLSGAAHDAAKAAQGKPLFVQNCGVCHGPAGRGSPEQGAPRLNDKIWLYGGTKADIVHTITHARNKPMPGFAKLVDPAGLKALAIYVHSLGGGK